MRAQRGGTHGERPRSRGDLGWFALAIAVVSVPCALQAWVTDDAFITLRTVEHFIEGRGVVWNPGQRVQTFTHPTWFLLLSAAIAGTREYFLTPIVIGLGLTLVTVALLVREAPRRGALVALALSASPSFVDYATSGLENPLTNLLVVLLTLSALRPTPSLRRVVTLSGLVLLTRPDGILACAPVALLLTVRAWRRDGGRATARALAVAGLPVVLWFAFALVYYGTVIPNTAHAKLGASLPLRHTLPIGLRYLATLGRDPAGALVIGAGAALALFARDGDRGTRVALVGGLLLHASYLAYIGGDYMLGRFFTPWISMGGALVVALRLPPPPPRRRGLRVGASLVLVGVAHVLVWSRHPWRPEPPTRRIAEDAIGVSDERCFYRDHLGIQAWWAGHGPETSHQAVWARLMATAGARAGGRPVLDGAQAGLFGFFASDDVHLLDPFGLGDPLLARLPAFRMPRYRAGHLPRPIPPGYAESERQGRNLFEDPALGALWERLRDVTRRPLLDPVRWRSVLWLLTHEATEELDRERYLLWHATRTTPEEVQRRPVRVPDMGIHIDLDETRALRTVTTVMTPADRRELWFYRGRERVAVVVTEASNEPTVVPEQARSGVDRIVLLPRDHYRRHRRLEAVTLFPRAGERHRP